MVNIYTQMEVKLKLGSISTFHLYLFYLWSCYLNFANIVFSITKMHIKKRTISCFPAGIVKNLSGGTGSGEREYLYYV